MIKLTSYVLLNVKKGYITPHIVTLVIWLVNKIISYLIRNVLKLVLLVILKMKFNALNALMNALAVQKVKTDIVNHAYLVFI